MEPEVIGTPDNLMAVMPGAWGTTGRAAWRLELIRVGWRKCPDGVWRYPQDWPPLLVAAS